jgi:RNA polymerase sigma-70 factor (ECF subfamily)
MANSSSPDPRFATTRWTLIVAAQQPAAEARAALADLCGVYWYPLYAYIRRRGHDASTAEDLTQAFFTRLLEKDVLAAANPDKGRFRSFLLTSCQHFLANERERANALKRGGGRVVSLDLGGAEARYRREPESHQTPERHFERHWALTLLAQVLERLRGEYEAGGKGRLFAALKGQLTGEGTADYATLGAELGLRKGSVKAAVHRLRKRYGELLRAEIADTVASPEEVEDEIRALFAALAAE